MSTDTAKSINPLRQRCRIVIVNWNSGNRLRQCLRSIPSGFEVVVVDNASEDLKQSGIPLQGFQCAPFLIRNLRNEGFAGAANLGATGCDRDFLLFLNPDVAFAGDVSADAMLRLLQERPDGAAATGKLMLPPTHTASQGAVSLIRPLPTLSSALADILFLDELGTKASQCPSGVAEIAQAPGACLLIRRRIFKELGGFDASFYPAWFEDVDLCRRLRDRGLKIFYQPESVFYHEGGYSTRRMTGSEFNRIFYGNMIRYFEKHHGKLATATLKIAVPMGNAARRVLHRFRRSTKHG